MDRERTITAYRSKSQFSSSQDNVISKGEIKKDWHFQQENLRCLQTSKKLTELTSTWCEALESVRTLNTRRSSVTFQQSETQTEIRRECGKTWNWREYFGSYPKHSNLRGAQENTVHPKTGLVWKDIPGWILKSISSEVSDLDISA